MKKEIIVLIFPPTGPNFPEPPFGLLSLGTMLQSSGFDVRIIDARYESIKKVIPQIQREYDILFAGLTTMTGPQIGYALKIARYLRKQGVGPIVWGGIHVTLLPVESIKSDYVDFILTGYADYTVVQFARALRERISLDEIDGIVFEENNRTVHNRGRPVVDVADLPAPDWSLLNNEIYANCTYTQSRAVYIFSSRGCPFSCTFCYGIPFHGKKWVARNAGQVLEEVDQLAGLVDFDVVYFHDDNFSIDRERVEKITRGLQERKKRYIISANLKLVDEELIKLLSETGCERLDLGLDSGSEKILAAYKKGYSMETVHRAIDILAESSVPTQWGFMVGHPVETIKDAMSSVEFIDHLEEKLGNVSFGDIKILTPYPGTEVFKTFRTMGWEPPAKLEEWKSYYWNTINLPTMKKNRFFIDLSFLSLFAKRYHHLHSRFRIVRLLYLLFHKTSLWRWRNRAFSFPVETRLMYWFLKFYLRLAL